jgi:hypothetical protein
MDYGMARPLPIMLGEPTVHLVDLLEEFGKKKKTPAGRKEPAPVDERHHRCFYPICNFIGKWRQNGVILSPFCNLVGKWRQNGIDNGGLFAPTLQFRR